MNSRIAFFVSIGFLWLASCKTGQVSQQQEKQLIVIDTSFQVPLTVLIQDTVSIPVFRLMKDTVSIIGVGDMMLGTNYPERAYLPPDSGKQVLSKVVHILKDADLTFGNLEGVLLNIGGNPKYCSNPKLCYLFRSPTHYAQHFVDAGFDVLSTANNHAGDFGEPGRRSTMNTLDSLGIEHAGLLAKPYTSLILDGMRYGFAAFAPNTGTVSINDLSNAISIVQHLDSINDIVVVSFHGGAEGAKHQHVTREREYFYGENRGNVYEFAHRLIDAGADVIFGHGPHVTRALEVYKDRFIIYSLGNFATYARFNLRGDNGIAPIIKVFTDSHGKFLYGKIFSVIQYAPGGPQLDHRNRAVKKLQELSTEDFPESPVFIDDSGNILYLQQ